MSKRDAMRLHQSVGVDSKSQPFLRCFNKSCGAYLRRSAVFDIRVRLGEGAARDRTQRPKWNDPRSSFDLVNCLQPTPLTALCGTSWDKPSHFRKRQRADDMEEVQEPNKGGGIVGLRTQILGECMKQRLTTIRALRADTLKRTQWSSSQQ